MNLDGFKLGKTKANVGLFSCSQFENISVTTRYKKFEKRVLQDTLKEEILAGRKFGGFGQNPPN